MEGDLTDAVRDLVRTGALLTLVEAAIEYSIEERAKHGPDRDEIALRYALALKSRGVILDDIEICEKGFGFANVFLAVRKVNPPRG